MDQLSSNHHQAHSQAPHIDVAHSGAIQQELIDFLSLGLAHANLDHCQSSHINQHSHCQNQAQDSFEQEYIFTSGLTTIPLDVHRSQNQMFLASLQDQTKKISSSHKHELNLKICRNNQRCVICQQQIKRKSVVFDLKCRHYFHHQCLKKWHEKHNTCPLCRKQIG